MQRVVYLSIFIALLKINLTSKLNPKDSFLIPNLIRKFLIPNTSYIRYSQSHLIISHLFGDIANFHPPFIKFRDCKSMNNSMWMAFNLSQDY